jgi:hypothetical protein
MSSFYNKYRHLFDGDSNIKLPSIKPKYSDYQFTNFDKVHNSKSRSVLPLKAMQEYKPPQYSKHERAESQKRPDYGDIKDRLFPKFTKDPKQFKASKCINENQI